MSKEGYDKLVAELQQLVKVELPRVKDAISEARDKGDLSENFEYHAAKREQGKLLSRMNFLQKVLEHARVLDTSQMKCEKVVLLSKVTFTNTTNNTTFTYTMVNPHEANLAEGKISIKSPIGEALLNRKVGDVIDVKVPAGIIHLKVDAITL